MIRNPSNEQAPPFWLVMDAHGVLLPSSEKWILTHVARDLHLNLFFVYVRWLFYLRAAQKGTLSAKKFYEKVLAAPLSEKEFHSLIMKRYAERGSIPPAMHAALLRLKEKGWKLAVLSDMNTAQAAYHREQKTFAVFDQVSLSAETGLMKPFPSSYAALEKRLRTRKDHIVFVDDLWFNTLAAQLLGWRAVTLKGERKIVRFLHDLN